MHAKPRPGTALTQALLYGCNRCPALQETGQLRTVCGPSLTHVGCQGAGAGAAVQGHMTRHGDLLKHVGCRFTPHMLQEGWELELPLGLEIQK